MTVSSPPMEIGDYFAILRRRKVALLVPFTIIIVVSAALALGLPPVYRSEATILVERQEIPQDLVETTITGFVEERLEGLSKRLLTWDTLSNMADKLDLYPEERGAGSRAEIVKRMKESITVEMVETTASDPDRRKGGVITIAFTVAFEDSQPEVAQKVAAELAMLYMDENKRLRAEQAAEVSRFLELEGKKLREEMVELEKKLAVFKQKNLEQLPDQKDWNIRFFEQTEEKLQSAEERIRLLETQRAGIMSQLAITNPYREITTQEGGKIQSASERLSALTAQYLSALANYSPDHPDLLKMRGEIESLEGQTGTTNKTSHLMEQLTIYRNKLTEARQKYSDEHPDVQKFEQSVAALEKKLRDTTYAYTREGVQTELAPPDNPTYVTLQAQLEGVSTNLKSEEVQRQRLTAKLREYEARLIQTPAVERDYLELTRDYDNARKKYQEIRDKQSEAELAQQLELGSKGQRLTLVQPAFLPTLPERPNRIGIALLGFVLALGGGVSVAAAAEYTDRTVRGSRGVLVAFNAPPLAVIPYIRTPEEQALRRKRVIGVSIGLVIAIIIGVAVAGLF